MPVVTMWAPAASNPHLGVRAAASRRPAAPAGGRSLPRPAGMGLPSMRRLPRPDGAQGRGQQRAGRTPQTTVASLMQSQALSDIINVTYDGESALWLTQEKQRLLDVAGGKAWDDLVLTRGAWVWEKRDRKHYRLRGIMTYHNTSKKAEIFVPEVDARVRLMCPPGLDGVESSVALAPQHEECELKERSDGYWPAYILKAGGSTKMEVTIDITASKGDLSGLEAAWLTVDYMTYGPHGRTPMAQDCVLPLKFPTPGPASWRSGEHADTLAIPTHLLCHLDDPVGAVQAYVAQYAQEGDIITIGESPLALMQGRFRHPRGVKPGWVAKFANRWFHPTSSLATGCGMQTLIDTTRGGALRIFLAVIAAAICRIFRVRGMFYRLAGPEAALIDDVTGTLPPYDQFICLGPARVAATCEAILQRTGIKCAVVDVNDLSIKTGAVRVLGRSTGFTDHDDLVMTEALKPNPAGNADEQTPLVLIRPKKV